MPPATVIGRGADRRVKLVLVGEQSVGKSSLAQRHIIGRAHHCDTALSSGRAAEDISPTVGVDFACKAMQIDKDPWPCRLHVWDTSGQQRFRQLVNSHLRDLDAGDAVVVVYDVTNARSFEAVDEWVSKARELAGGSPQIAILGTKLDKALEAGRQVSIVEGQRKADELGAVLFLETRGVVRDKADSDSECEQRVFQACIESLLRKCRAATPPEVSLGVSMPDAHGQGLAGVMPGKTNSRYQCFSPKKGIAYYFCKGPWRSAFQCFGFA